MNEKKLLFLFNPKSGKEQIGGNLLEILDIFVKAGYEVTAHPTQSEGDARRMAACAAGYDRIVCSGGDGTLNEVVNGMQEAGIKIPVGYIPAGSTNDFAQSLKIPKHMPDAARIAAGDHLFACDVGKFNESCFIYVAAFGLFTDVSYLTSHDLKQKLGHGAYVLEGIKSLKDIPKFHMEVRTEGQMISGEFLYGTISNSYYIGGVKNLIAEEIKLDDGILEVNMIRYPENPMQLNQILTNLMMPRQMDTDYICRFQTRHIEISSEEAVPWTLDGEFGGNLRRADIRCLQRAMCLPAE